MSCSQSCSDSYSRCKEIVCCNSVVYTGCDPDCVADCLDDKSSCEARCSPSGPTPSPPSLSPPSPSVGSWAEYDACLRTKWSERRCDLDDLCNAQVPRKKKSCIYGFLDDDDCMADIDTCSDNIPSFGGRPDTIVDPCTGLTYVCRFKTERGECRSGVCTIQPQTLPPEDSPSGASIVSLHFTVVVVVWICVTVLRGQGCLSQHASQRTRPHDRSSVPQNRDYRIG